MNGNIIYVNHAQVDMLEYTREELLSANVDIYGDDPVHNIRQQDIVEMTLQNGDWRGQIINHSKHGKECFLDCRTQVITNSDGECIALCGIATDISTQKKLEQELIVAKEKAEESDRLKSAFLANMSHEIRTPMNGILGFAGLLKEPGLTGKEQREYIHIIEKSGKRMLSIIHDIVDISKIESGQMEIHLSTTNINEQVEFIYHFFLPEAEQKGIRISFKNALSFKDAIMNTDREKIYAILTNLVKNAIKYTHAGSIEFGYEKKGEFLEFFTRDTGIGIAGDRQKAIFERFVQADMSDKHAYEGAGLGLSIAKAYVEMLGGEIWVESEEGKGSDFYFTIPHLVQEDRNILLNTIPEPAADATLKKLTILIAEDDENSELLITAYFKKISLRIFRAVTGREAVRICRENPEIDLVLMDIRMPEMNGYEATHQIRQFNKDIVIIAQTAYGLSGDREISIASGCNDYISKPINRDALMALLEKYFNPAVKDQPE
jgi:PAS domain S-box-containing protein